MYNMINLIGEEWYNLLSDYLESDNFKDVGKQLIKEYKTKNVIPPLKSDLFFKIFKDLQPSKIKIIVIGQD